MQLAVVGNPLVLSKHRVQHAASEVLHSLLQQHPHQHQHQQPALCGASGGGSSSSSSSPQGGEACSLDFGIIPAGLEVQRSFFVRNTGAWPRLTCMG